MSITQEQLQRLRNMEAEAGNLRRRGEPSMQEAADTLAYLSALADNADALLTIAEREPGLIDALLYVHSFLCLTKNSCARNGAQDEAWMRQIQSVEAALKTAGEYPRQLNEKAPSSMPL